MHLILAAILVGLLLPVQAGVNAQLRLALVHPLSTAFISFLVGTVALGALVLLGRYPLPLARAAGVVPPWQWTGGLLGALYIFAAVVLAPRLGAATLIASVVAGQMVGSIVLDHFGWVGFQVHELNPARLLGALLVIAGVILVRR
jgi:bacterial/archaeal transporter family-2 protein